MKITSEHREKLTFFLKKFYNQYPQEKYTIFNYVKWMKERITKRKRDAWEALSGETGTGKSYFAIMALILYKGRRTSLTRNVTYIPKGDEIKKAFDKLNKEKLIIDEAAREMRSINWHSRGQQDVNEKAMTDRFKSNWVTLILPNFNEFTKSMKKGNMQFRTIVLYRTDKYARVIVQRKLRNWRSDDPWCDKEASDKYFKAMKKYKGDLTDKEVLSVERSLPNTIMDFIVPDLSLILPELTDEYERLKIDSRINKDVEEKKEAKQKDKFKIEYDKLLNRLSKVIINDELEIKERKKPPTREEIAEFLGISTYSLSGAYNKPRLEATKLPSFRR